MAVSSAYHLDVVELLCECGGSLLSRPRLPLLKRQSEQAPRFQLLRAWLLERKGAGEGEKASKPMLVNAS